MSGITSLSMFLTMRPGSLVLAGLAKLNVKLKTEKFEERVTVKIIIERILKALLNGKKL